MIRAFAVAVAITAIGSRANTPSRPITLQDLTLPADRLSAACSLLPTTQVHLEGNRVLRNSTGFPTNPWIGSDRRLVATIRQAIDGPTLLPDGPALSRKELSRFESQLADGIEEAYAAVYVEPDGRALTVRALRLALGERLWDQSNDTRLPTRPEPLRLSFGPIVVTITGYDGDCFRVVGGYFKSLVD